MIYNEGITINGLHSYVDFGLNINARKIDLPLKQSIRKKVPFMNGFYDYSKINGAVTWGERIISYTFDIIGETVEEMDLKRTEVLNWLCNMHDVDIYDDTIKDYHFHGSFDTQSQNEDGEKSELTVNFVCYPFMIANEAMIMYTNGPDVTVTLNNTGQPLQPYVETSQGCTVQIANKIQSVPAGETRLSMIANNGENNVRVTKKNELVYPYQETNHTENGITYSVNANGTITANGTATDVSWFYLRGSTEKFKLPVGYHLLQGCPQGGSGTTYRMQAYAYHGSEKTPVYSYDAGEGGVVLVNESTEYISIAIRIAAGYTANNLVFTPTLYGETKIKWFTEVL